MPTNIPGSSASYPANVVAPVDGDARNAASIQTPLTNLADRTAYLKANGYPHVLSFGNGDLGTAAGTVYLDVGYSASAASATGSRGVLIPQSGTIFDIRVSAGTAHAGAGSTVKVRVKKNGVDTACECTLAAGATAASDVLDHISVAAGDRIEVVAIKAGTITASAKDVFVSLRLLLP